MLSSYVVLQCSCVNVRPHATTSNNNSSSSACPAQSLLLSAANIYLQNRCRLLEKETFKTASSSRGWQWVRVELWLFIHLPMFLLPMCVMTTVLCTLQWCRCLVSQGCWCQQVWLFFSSVSKVNFNEPISMLQRLSEDLEYHELLDKAAKCHSSLEQMCYVAAFSVSSYSTTVHRTGKPFNPLLGETFELDRRRESGYRSLCEQVRAPTKAGCQCTGLLKGK